MTKIQTIRYEMNATYGKHRLVFVRRNYVKSKKKKHLLWLLMPIPVRYEYRTKPGTITMTNYTKAEATHWEIKTSLDKTIQLQFDKSFGFGIEYHRRCFYDKLFIYDSSKTDKYARICGPKPNQAGLLHVIKNHHYARL